MVSSIKQKLGPGDKWQNFVHLAFFCCSCSFSYYPCLMNWWKKSHQIQMGNLPSQGQLLQRWWLAPRLACWQLRPWRECARISHGKIAELNLIGAWNLTTTPGAVQCVHQSFKRRFAKISQSQRRPSPGKKPSSSFIYKTLRIFAFQTACPLCVMTFA